MSLTRRNDGCPQCRNRRLRCDKTEPECLKCLKKGLRCSGQGFECRFSSHMNKISVHKGIQNLGGRASDPLPTSIPDSVHSGSLSLASTPAPARRRRSHLNTSSPPQAIPISPEIGICHIPETRFTESPTILVRDLGSPIITEETPPSSSAPELEQPDPNAPGIVTDDVAAKPLPLVIRRTIEPLSPQRRLLFHHFSEFIAAKMVVFDSSKNGYRDIMLPIACQDEVVGSAVCAVAAFHLGANASHLLATAEATQHAVLTKLLRDSMELTPRRIFSMSTWAAILVLLVGDTITGSKNYIQLLEMLRHLAYSVLPDCSMPAEARAFLLQQTKMFELFSSALTNEQKGLELLSGPIEPYLDFVAYPTDDARYSSISSIRSAIQTACGLCLRRLQNDCSYICPEYQLAELKRTILSLEPSVEGAHALVWTCFVAAAESVLPAHREFFSHRLGSLYACTKFGTIPQALDILELIWEKQGKQKWTELVTLERPILIM